MRAAPRRARAFTWARAGDWRRGDSPIDGDVFPVVEMMQVANI
jgi:hypothetical protein